MQIRQKPLMLCPILLLAGMLGGTVLAAETSSGDLTPPGESYVTRTNEPGNRTAATGRVGGTSFAFTRLDTNGNERLSRSEVAGSQELAQQFDRIDGNHDFQITPSEFSAFEVEQMRAQQKPAQAAAVEEAAPGAQSEAVPEKAPGNEPQPN